MHVAQVDFTFDDAQSQPKAEAEEAALDRLFWVHMLLAAWGMHGQVAATDFGLVQIPRGQRAWLLVPDADSLQPEHDSPNGRQDRQKLQELGVQVRFEMLGEDDEGSDTNQSLNRAPRHVCRCSGRAGLILFTRWYSVESPLRCLSCFGLVPQYQISATEGQEHALDDSLNRWANDYRACDTLQLGSVVGEKWALRQMGSSKSKLSRQGRKLCRRLEKSLDVPVYYYLHRYYGRSLEREEARKCPRCGGKWRLKEEWHGEFDFKCDGCRLLSNIARSIG